MDTRELLNDLCQTRDIKAFMEENMDEFRTVTVADLLNELSVQRDMSVAQVAKASGCGDYVYKVFHGERKASRDVILAVAVGMGLTVKETGVLLRVARQAALDPRDKRDSIILYGLKENLDVCNLNDLLYEMQEKTL